METERFSHVAHLVSEVVGELREGVRPFDVLRACFPAGTVSGAPKVRAMQLIAELEGRRRGPVRGRGRLRAAGRRPRHLHRDPDDRPPRRRRAPPGRRGDRRRLRPARRARGVPAEAGSPRDRDYACRAMILLVDNYDSFTYNLVHLFEELGAEVVVRRNDEVDADEAERLAPSHLVVSPGPGRPGDSGATRRDRPATGADHADPRRLPRPPGDRRGVRRRDRPGAASSCTARRARSSTTAAASSTGLPQGFQAGRYHSLAAVEVPAALEISATTADGEVMAVRHRELPVDGVQFHPESVLTPVGPDLCRNFLGR